MCIACVMKAGAPAAAGPEASGDSGGNPAGWSASDAGRAAVVYRQLPRWSRRLFALLSAAPGREYPVSLLQVLLVEPGSPFGMQDVRDWAAPFCAAVGRTLPVLIAFSASGEPRYHMDQPAARLFELAADASAAPR
ncbi:MAG: hypothetical protein ACRDNZ_07735 [Streptosporangiaceae bacterium]